MLEQKDSPLEESRAVWLPALPGDCEVRGGAHPAHQHILVPKSAPCCPLESNTTVDVVTSPPCP